SGSHRRTRWSSPSSRRPVTSARCASPPLHADHWTSGRDRCPTSPRSKPVFLAVVGGLSIGAAILTLFFSLGRRPSALDVTAAPAVESPEFLASVTGIAGSPLREGGTVELLNNGDAFFPALLRDIAQAKKTINFEVFIW